MSSLKHIPVMVDQVLSNFPDKCKVYFDGTVGHAGHCKIILNHFPNLQAIVVDKDANMLDIAKNNLQDFKNRVDFTHCSYKDIDKVLGENKVDAIFLDLGVNMQHFKDAKRGFSIKLDGPLDMRFDTSKGVTAEFILKNYTKEQLEDILYKYGDFKGILLQKISETILKHKHKLKTTKNLVDLMADAGISMKKVAVLFQVLRIQVNQELLELESFLEKFGKFLNPGGRCLILTYHSIEDRIVKNVFKNLDKKLYLNLTKKVIFPTLEEMKINKASRSAKLRIIEKI